MMKVNNVHLNLGFFKSKVGYVNTVKWWCKDSLCVSSKGDYCLLYVFLGGLAQFAKIIITAPNKQRIDFTRCLQN